MRLVCSLTIGMLLMLPPSAKAFAQVGQADVGASASPQGVAVGAKAIERAKRRVSRVLDRVERRSICKQQANERGLDGSMARRHTRYCLSQSATPSTLRPLSR